jgi:hypothetical protein
MHVKYRQHYLHRMTWYTSTCNSNGHGLTIHVRFMVKCVCYIGLWIHWLRDHGATIPNGSVGLDHATNVMYGMLCNG